MWRSRLSRARDRPFINRRYGFDVGFFRALSHLSFDRCWCCRWTFGAATLRTTAALHRLCIGCGSSLVGFCWRCAIPFKPWDVPLDQLDDSIEVLAVCWRDKRKGGASPTGPHNIVKCFV